MCKKSMFMFSFILLFALVASTNVVVAEDGTDPPSQMIWADPYHNTVNAWGLEYGELFNILPNATVGGCCGTDHRHIEEISKVCT